MGNYFKAHITSAECCGGMVGYPYKVEGGYKNTQEFIKLSDKLATYVKLWCKTHLMPTQWFEYTEPEFYGCPAFNVVAIKGAYIDDVRKLNHWLVINGWHSC